MIERMALTTVAKTKHSLVGPDASNPSHQPLGTQPPATRGGLLLECLQFKLEVHALQTGER
jgi:hypothetical protein